MGWALSGPATFTALFVLTIVAWIALGAVWASRLIRNVHGDEISPPLRDHPVRWGAMPLLLVAAILLGVNQVSFHVRFDLSRSAMDAAARRVLAHPPSVGRIHQIGLWDVQCVEAHSSAGEMGFLVRGTGGYGFAYSPLSPPYDIGTGTEEDGFSHVSGPWYVWGSARDRCLPSD